MGLRDELDSTTVEQLNTRPPVTIPQSATVREAVATMRDAGLGCVFSVDEDGRATGSLTEGMLRHELNTSADLLDRPLADYVVDRFPWVLPSDPASMILEAMEEHNTRFIAVLDSERHVLGITGQKTLMEFVASCLPRIVLTEDPTGVTHSEKREGA